MATGNLKISQLDLTSVGNNDFVPLARGTGNYRVNLSGAVTGVLASWPGSSSISTVGTLVAGAIPESLLTFTDITDGNASATEHGFVPKLPNDANYFYNGVGNYSIPPGLTGVIPVASGGTNITSYASGDLLYASNSTTLAKLPAGASGHVLTMGASYPGWVSGSSSATDETITFSDITTNNSSSTKHGFLPKLPNNASLFLNGTGGWTSTSGGQSLTVSGLGSTTALLSNYLYTGTITGRTVTLPSASNQDVITYRGIAALDTTITWPSSSVLQVGASGYATGTYFPSGSNVEFSLAYVAPYWFLADSASPTGAYYQAGGTDVAVADGGTNLSSYTTGDLIYASAETTLAKLGIGTSSQYLGVVGGIPAWTTGNLGNLTGVVGVANGGTNITSYASGDLLYATNSNTLAKLAAGTSGYILTMGAAYPSWQSGFIGGYQPLDATLTALAETTITADKLVYATGNDAFGTIDFPAAGRSLASADNPAAQRAVMDAAALGSANAFTATNDFIYSPSINRTILSPSLQTGNSVLNVGEFKYDIIQSGRSITFGGTPVEGSQIALKLNVTGAPILTIPSSKRFGESGAAITSLGLYPGIHKLLWERVNGEWLLSDTVGTYNKLDATSAPTINDGTLSGYSINSRWIDVSTDITYDCTDNVSGAALWRENVHALPAQTIYNKTLGTGTKYALGSDATGDMWYRGTDGLTSRLGIGSSGQVLTVSDGLPAWAAGGAGGGSGLVDPGSNGIVKRTALNTTAIAVAGTDYYSPGNIRTSLGISLDGAGSVPTTGIKGYLTVPYNCTIAGWNIVADQTNPSGTFDVWKTGQGINLPTIAGTIMGTKPSLTTGNAVRSSNLSGWTTSITSGDILGIALDSVANGYKWNFQLEVLR